MQQEKPIRVLRLYDLKGKIGLGRTAIYDMVAKGKFPKQVQLSERTTGWLEHEVDAWLEQRAAERSQAKNQAA